MRKRRYKRTECFIKKYYQQEFDRVGPDINDDKLHTKAVCDQRRLLTPGCMHIYIFMFTYSKSNRMRKSIEHKTNIRIWEPFSRPGTVLAFELADY